MRALAFILLVTASCASESAALRAADSPLNAPGAGAYYEINPAQRTIGDVKVWSGGAHEEGDKLVVDIGMRLRNNSEAPITIDTKGCGLEMVREHDEQAIDDETTTSGETTIAPGGMGRVTLRYVLPAKTDLDKVTAFDFYWRLATSDGAFSHSTAFQRVTTASGAYYSPYWGYPYGYWGAGWGPGWGPGFGLGFSGYYRPAPRPFIRPAPPRR
jgi:hypothetical protein